MYTIKAKARKNARRYTKTLRVFADADMQDVKDYITNNRLEVLPSPYMFTHIPLSDDTIIVQEVGAYRLMTTPQKLYSFLTA